MSNWEILQGLVFEPRKAFAELGERPRFWLPLLLLVIALGGIQAWYSNVVDLAWATDQQLRNNTFARNNLTDEQIALAVQQAAERGHSTAGAILNFIGVGLVIPLFMLLVALFYWVVGKVASFDRSYRHWYAFCFWVAVPLAIGAIPQAVALATIDTTQFTQEALKTLSLNALVFHRALGEPGYSFLANFDLFTIASLYLSLIAVKVWSGRSWLFTGLFIGIPWGLIYGLWALASFR